MGETGDAGRDGLCGNRLSNKDLKGVAAVCG